MSRILAERGLMVSNETIRRWVHKFGPLISKNLRETRFKAYTRWHLDEMVVSIAGRQNDFSLLSCCTAAQTKKLSS